MGKVGFNIGNWSEEEKKSENVKIAINDVEKEFKYMISKLELDEDFHVNYLSIEERVRKELIKIYRRLKKIEKKIEKSNNLFHQCQGIANDYPEKSLKFIEKISKLDNEIIPEAEAIIKEIHKHTLHDIAELYRGTELSGEQIKNIRTLASILSSRLSAMMAPIHQALGGQQLEMFRRDIVTRNPNLG